MKRIAMTLLAAAMLLPLMVGAQTTVSKSLTWTAPTVDASHSAAATYIVNWRPVGQLTWNVVGAGPITSPTATIDIPTGVAVEARVMAVDAQGNQGPWSPTSDPYTHKVPNGCGKPSWL